MTDLSPPGDIGFFAELRRRRVLRTLALYIVGAWILMQVADVVLPALDIPERSIRYLLLAAVGGFPVALVFAWFFDVSAAGIHRTAPASAAEASDPAPLRAADFAILGALVLVLVAVIYGVVGNVVDLPVPQAGADAAAPAARGERGDGPPMIGVLPFDSIGNSEDGAFFASGVHDDLLTRLAQIQSLRVVSRTSVLAYAGTSKKIPVIGRELGADAILEGGLRIAGEQLRINAQLIDARTDEHLWAETFDRKLTSENIFAVQAEIARAIASAMAATLSEQEVEDLLVVPTRNLAAYRAYHEAMQVAPGILTDQQVSLEEFQTRLRRAIDLDPEFTRPLMELVGILALENFREPNPDEVQEIEAFIERIAVLAPQSVEHLTAQSYYFYYILHDYARADDLISQAQTKAPSDIRLLEIQSWIKRRKGDFEGYLEATRAASTLEPGNVALKTTLVGRLMLMHRYDEAERLANSIENADVRLSLRLADLALRQHKDLSAYRADIEEVLGQPDPVAKRVVADAYVNALLAEREYSAAQAVARDRLVPIYQDLFAGLAAVWGPYFELLIHIQSGQSEALAGAVSALRAAFGVSSLLSENLPRGFLDPDDFALFAIAEGEPDTARQMMLDFMRDNADDPTAMLMARHRVCKIFGLAGAAKDAVACLRAGITGPSAVQPYFDPLLPEYDPIRDSSLFQELLRELERDGWIAPQTVEVVKG